MTAGSDELARLVGKPLTDEAVSRALASLGNPWLPKIEPPAHHDWLVVGNLEFGFEDAAHFRGQASAADEPPILEQICFYAPRGGLQATHPPPFALSYGLPRADVRRLLAKRAAAVRLRRRDVFEFPEFTLVAGYDPAQLLDSALILAWRGERPGRAEPPLGFQEIARCFGRSWYDAALRSRLYSLTDAEGAVAQIKKHGTLDLVAEAGVRLLFQKSGDTRVLNGVEIYRSRVHDAAKWEGDLPFDIQFTDDVDDISRKVGAPPQSTHDDDDRQGRAIWTRGEFRIVVIFDLIVNLVASITVAGAERWS